MCPNQAFVDDAQCPTLRRTPYHVSPVLDVFLGDLITCVLSEVSDVWLEL